MYEGYKSLVTFDYFKTYFNLDTHIYLYEKYTKLNYMHI